MNNPKIAKNKKGKEILRQALRKAFLKRDNKNEKPIYDYADAENEVMDNYKLFDERMRGEYGQ